MKTQLLKLLSCPECRCPLAIEVRECDGEEIQTGTLRCPTCKREFPIRGGIPRFAPAAAYASSFSFEWKQWRRTQFDTSTRRVSERSFNASTGWALEALKGRLVVDAGCGAGRFTDLAARAGAEVVGIDLSQAIEVAQENLRHRPNCHFVQADILKSPFRPGVFDLAFSIGVLHHTPNTREGFRRLVETVRPGGEVAIWVYPMYRLAETFEYFPDRVEEVLALDVNYRIPVRGEAMVRRYAKALDWIMETSSAVERAFTTRLPPRVLYWFCHAAIPLYYLYRIPLFYPLRLITKIAMHPEPEWRVLDTFDWYSPKYQWKHTYPEVRRWFAEAGLEEIKILPRPVAMRGKKPAKTV